MFLSKTKHGNGIFWQKQKHGKGIFLQKQKNMKRVFCKGVHHRVPCSPRCQTPALSSRKGDIVRDSFVFSLKADDEKYVLINIKSLTERMPCKKCRQSVNNAKFKTENPRKSNYLKSNCLKSNYFKSNYFNSNYSKSDYFKSSFLMNTFSRWHY